VIGLSTQVIIHWQCNCDCLSASKAAAPSYNACQQSQEHHVHATTQATRTRIYQRRQSDREWHRHTPPAASGSTQLASCWRAWSTFIELRSSDVSPHAHYCRSLRCRRQPPSRPPQARQVEVAAALAVAAAGCQEHRSARCPAGPLAPAGPEGEGGRCEAVPAMTSTHRGRASLLLPPH
jgi:hypothetical protein